MPSVPYLTHPVRRIRDDPTDGEEVSLLLGFDEDAGEPPVGAIEAVVADAGGTIDRELEFATLEVTVPQPALADVCELDGLTRVETSGTLGLAVESAEPADDTPGPPETPGESDGDSQG